MRLKNYMTMMVVALCAMACNEDNKESVNPAKEVTGTYNGYTVANSQMFKDKTAPKQTITLNDNEDETVNLTFTSTTWGQFTVSNAKVTVGDNSYIISGSGKTTMGMGGSSKEYECTLQGSMKSDKTEPSFTLNVPAVMGGLNIVFAAGDPLASTVVAGSYKGTLALSVMGKPQNPVNDSKITFAAEEKGTVKVVMAKFGEGAMAIPEDIAVEGVKVETTDYVTYTIAETTVNIKMGNTSYKVVLGGTVKDEKANLTFAITPGSMPFAITATFTSAE